MKKSWLLTLVFMICFYKPSEANDGELSISYISSHYKPGSMTYCSYGYYASKSGDHETAVKIMQNCADAGHLGSMVWLAYMYENGFGVQKDLKHAVEIIHRAAKKGYSIGQYHYGMALLQGHGVEEDKKAGLSWLNRAASQGDADAKALLEKMRYED